MTTTALSMVLCDAVAISGGTSPGYLSGITLVLDQYCLGTVQVPVEGWTRCTPCAACVARCRPMAASLKYHTGTSRISR